MGSHSLFHLQISVVILGIFVGGRDMQRTCSGKEQMKEARSCCQHLGKSLPTPASKQENVRLYRELTSKRRNSSWLDIYRREFPSWTWVDNTIADSMSLNGEGCAYFNTTSGQISSNACGSVVPGTMCYIKDCRSCYQLGSLSRVCYHVGDVCFVFLCEDRNWFDAASLCSSFDASLALIKNINTIKNFHGTDICDLFWIGLRKEDWFFHGSNKSLGETGASVWGASYSDNNGDCSVFYIMKPGYQWHRTTCDIRQSYICVGAHAGDGTKTTEAYPTIKGIMSTKSIGSMRDQNITVYAVLGTLIGLALVMFSIAVILKVLTNKNVKRARKTEEIQMSLKDASEESIASEDEEVFLEQTTYRTEREETPTTTCNGKTNPGDAIHIVDCDPDTGVLTLHFDLLSTLLSDPSFNDPVSPLVVVSISGPFRTGKSFLMNYLLRYLLAKETKEEDGWMEDQKAPLLGFKWDYGSTVTTYGIWIWSKPIRITLSDNSEVCVLLMDTQGLYELDRKVRHSATMTTLSCLLSSLQIYNVPSQVTEEDLERLNVFGSAAKIILEEEGKTDSAIKPVQSLLFLVRDWVVGPKGTFACGYESGNRYITKRLRSKSLRETQRQLREELMEKVHKCECFLMPHPGELAAGGRKEYNGNLKGLGKEFKESLHELVTILFDGPNICRLQGGRKTLLGSELCRRIMLYVSAFNADRCAVPFSTTRELLSETNKLAYKKAINSYYQRLYELVKNRDTMIDCGSDTIKHMKSVTLSLYDSSSVPERTSRDAYRADLKKNMNKITPAKIPAHDKYDVLEALASYIEEMRSIKGKTLTEEQSEVAHTRSINKACHNLSDPMLHQTLMDVIDSIKPVTSARL